MTQQSNEDTIQRHVYENMSEELKQFIVEISNDLWYGPLYMNKDNEVVQWGEDNIVGDFMSSDYFEANIKKLGTYLDDYRGLWLDTQCDYVTNQEPDWYEVDEIEEDEEPQLVYCPEDWYSFSFRDVCIASFGRETGKHIYELVT